MIAMWGLVVVVALSGVVIDTPAMALAWAFVLALFVSAALGVSW